MKLERTWKGLRYQLAHAIVITPDFHRTFHLLGTPSDARNTIWTVLEVQHETMDAVFHLNHRGELRTFSRREDAIDYVLHYVGVLA